MERYFGDEEMKDYNYDHEKLRGFNRKSKFLNK